MLATLCVIRLSLLLRLVLCLCLLDCEELLLLLLLLEVLRLVRDLLLKMHHRVDWPHGTGIPLHRSQLSRADALSAVR
jgi:hypothetical protein